MTSTERPRRGSSSSSCSTLRRDRKTTSPHAATALPPPVADLCRLRQDWKQTTTIKTFWEYLKDEATEELKRVICKHPEKEDPMFREQPELFLVSGADRPAYQQLSKQLAKRDNKSNKRVQASSLEDEQHRPSKRTKRSSSIKTDTKKFDVSSSSQRLSKTRPSGVPNEQQHALYSLISLYRDTIMQQSSQCSPATIMGLSPKANHRSAVTFIRSGRNTLLAQQPTLPRSTLVRTHS